MGKLQFYQEHLQQEIYPFWERAFDYENGGVYTCFDNQGSRKISSDKYVWSQGRYLWVTSRLYTLANDQKVTLSKEALERQSTLTMFFLKNNVLLDNGTCAFLLSEKGEKKEVKLGEGYDSSIFADCFVLLGFIQYIEAFDQPGLIDWVLRLYENVLKRIESGVFRTDPYPVPLGMVSHSVPMILLNLSHELGEMLKKMDHSSYDWVERQEKKYLNMVLEFFTDDKGRIKEIANFDGTRTETVLHRHLNPGHTLEEVWFVLHSLRSLKQEEKIPQVIKIAEEALRLGWDEEAGGIFRYVDFEKGGPPLGEQGTDDFSKLISATWDYKLWWPHSEALYTLLLLEHQFAVTKLDCWYQLVFDYTFKNFPQKDKKIGEWIQIRDRYGIPVDKVVALPVKDPYHIMRNLILIIELLSK